MTASLIGRKIGRYLIVSELGRGGMASVYRAFDQVLERDIALKVLRPDLASDDEIVRRFHKGASAEAKLEHPNIIAVYDVGSHRGRHFISMQLLDGDVLSKLIATEAPISVGRGFRILRQIAVALDYAHSQGLIHRDVKPGNIMITNGDHATLLDFGIVKDSGTNLTEHGTLLGTPDYMSPEQAQGDEVGPGTDIYSLGTIAYEIFTGRLPFTAESSIDVIRMKSVTQPIPMTQLNPLLPTSIESAVLRALDRNPQRRWPTAGSFVDAMRPSDKKDRDRSVWLNRLRTRLETVHSVRIASSLENMIGWLRGRLPSMLDQARTHRRSLVAGGSGVVLAIAGMLAMQHALSNVNEVPPTAIVLPDSPTAVHPSPDPGNSSTSLDRAMLSSSAATAVIITIDNPSTATMLSRPTSVGVETNTPAPPGEFDGHGPVNTKWAGVITYVLPTRTGMRDLVAFIPNSGISRTLVANAIDVQVLSVSPDQRYLAVGVSHDGSFSTVGRGVGSNNVSLVVLSRDGLLSTNVVTRASAVDASYIGDGRLLIGVKRLESVEYLLADARGQGATKFYASTNQ